VRFLHRDAKNVAGICEACDLPAAVWQQLVKLEGAARDVENTVSRVSFMEEAGPRVGPPVGSRRPELVKLVRPQYTAKCLKTDGAASTGVAYGK
jgi:hypothetical protein